MADQERDDKNEEREEQDAGAKSEEGLGDGGKRALEAERKARRSAEKRMKDLESKIKEAEDAEKSEIERLKDQVADLTRRAEKAEADSMRFAVAAAQGLSLAQARRLVGSTKEELETDAQEMRAELGLDKDDSDEDDSDDKNEERDEKDEETGKPRERLKPGASNEEDEEPDAGKLADSLLASRIF